MKHSNLTPQDVAHTARLDAIDEIKTRAGRGWLGKTDYEEMGVGWPPLENWKSVFIQSEVRAALKAAGFEPNADIITKAGEQR